MQYSIRFDLKKIIGQKFTIYIDNRFISKNASKCKLMTEAGRHNIRIEQNSIIKSKNFWSSNPFLILLSVIFGFDNLGGKTPFYIKYEGELDVQKDIVLQLELVDNYKGKKYSKKGLSYQLAVHCPVDIDMKVIRNECVATPRETRKWFSYYVTMWTLTFGFLAFVFVFGAVNSFLNGAIGLIGFMIYCFFGIIFALCWVRFIKRDYKRSKGIL